MKPTDKSDIALPLSSTASQADDHVLMPGEFAGMYQAGFEAGCSSGREAGYQQGFSDGFRNKTEFAGQTAAIEKTVDRDAHKLRVAVTPLPVEGQPATKNGPLDPDTRKPRVPGPPRRVLLGMPCKTCRVYLMSDETHCPCCKQKVA
jgi:hypothetical protein